MNHPEEHIVYAQPPSVIDTKNLERITEPSDLVLGASPESEPSSLNNGGDSSLKYSKSNIN